MKSLFELLYPEKYYVGQVWRNKAHDTYIVLDEVDSNKVKIRFPQIENAIVSGYPIIALEEEWELYEGPRLEGVE